MTAVPQPENDPPRQDDQPAEPTSPAEGVETNEAGEPPPEGSPQSLQALLSAHFGAEAAEPPPTMAADADVEERHAPPPRGSAVMERMADAAIARYERLPMLNVVLDRVVRQFAERLMQMMSTQVDASLTSVEPGRFGDMAHEVKLPCLLAIVSASEWGGECVIAVDQRLIYSIVEILLGGESPSADRVLEMRAPTPIERRLTQRIFQTLCEMLETEFAPLRPTPFTIQRVETNPQFAMIARSAAAAVRARIRLDVDGQTGHVDVIVPYTTLEPARAQLGQMFLGESLGRDAYWDQRLTGRLAAAPVRLTARMAAEPARLSTVMAWKPGDVLPLRAQGPTARATLTCKTIGIGEGAVGAKNGRIAVKLDQVRVAARRETAPAEPTQAPEPQEGAPPQAAPAKDAA